MTDLPSDPAGNPCLRCGACCAYFRCSFYWGEADDVTPYGVPVQFTEDITPFRRAMRGTDAKAPRCICLLGEIGHSARCAIYERRSTVCRAFLPSFADGRPNPDCDKARAAHGLVPLTAEDWKPSGDKPRQPTKPRRPRAA